MLYISFLTYTFDILFFIAPSFVIPYLSREIYPSVNVGISLLVTWGGFAAGALFRPVGAAIIGPRVDTIGRKRTLYIALTGAAIATALLAATPTYKQVGVLAPVVYTVLVMISGFFIGAVVSVGLVYGPENFPERLRGFLTGVSESGGSLAHTIGSLWLLLTAVLVAGSAYFLFGWRLMFLVSIIPLVMVLPVLYFTPESEIFALSKKSSKKSSSSPIRDIFRQPSTRTAFLLLTFMAIGMLGADNLLINQLPTFLRVVNKFPPSLIAQVALVASIGGVLGSWVGGAVSQGTGRKPVALVATAIMAVMSYLFIIMGRQTAALAPIVMAIVFPMYFVDSNAKASLSLYLNETFPTVMRGTALGLIWNIGYGIASVWPVLISAFIATSGVRVYPLVETVMVASLSVLGLLCAIFTREPRGNIYRERQTLTAGTA
ncbi:MFS transporter [Sulfodiicoccus acidiphilus]|nr:MFS transporter [Sulfodiicoccus acidiphilus]